MNSTDGPVRRKLTALLDGKFDRLRAAFFARTRSDRERMAEHLEKLTNAQAIAPPLLEDVRLLAHRICGGASIFEAPNILQAAAAVEQAALDSLRQPDVMSIARLRSSIETLLSQL